MNRWIPIAAAVTLSLSPLIAQNTPDAEPAKAMTLEEVIKNLETKQTEPSEADAFDTAFQEPISAEDNVVDERRSGQRIIRKAQAVDPGEWARLRKSGQNPFQWKNTQGEPVDFGWVSSDSDEVLRTFWNLGSSQNSFDRAVDFYQSGSGSRAISVSSGSDGSLTVKVNGKEVDDSRLRHKDGEVEVLGEDGVVLFRFKHNNDGTAEIPKGTTGFFTFDAPTAKQGAGRPLIGINMEPVSKPLAYHLDLEPNSGIMITGVINGFSAERAGVKKYDIVVGINGEGGVTMQSLRDAVAAHAGKSIRLAILRQGQRMVLEVPVELRKTASNEVDPAASNFRWADPMRVDPRLDRELRWRPFISSDGSLVMDPLIGSEAGAWNARRYGEQSEAIDPQVPSPGADSDSTLERLEKRLDRLEKLIERIEKKF